MVFISKYLDNDIILTLDNVNDVHELKKKLYDLLNKSYDIELKKKFNYNDIFIFNKDTNDYCENNLIITDKLNNFYYKILFNKCSICMKQAVNITGDCSYCNYKFCNIHRLPEYHNCISIKDCRTKSYDENYKRVIKQKCVATQL